MMDMGFRPDLERIVSRTPERRQTLFFSATLAGAAGDLARAYTHKARHHAHRPTAEKTAPDRAPLRPGPPRGKARRAGRGARGRPRPRARLRPHQARRRPARQAPRPRGIEARGDARQQDPEPARARARRVRARARSTRWSRPTSPPAASTSTTSRTSSTSTRPRTRTSYVHRMGRTGRAGRDGLAITFVMADQARDIGAIASKLGLQGDSSARASPRTSRSAPQHQPSRNGGGSSRRRPQQQRPRRRSLARQPPLGASLMAAPEAAIQRVHLIDPLERGRVARASVRREHLGAERIAVRGREHRTARPRRPIRPCRRTRPRNRSSAVRRWSPADSTTKRRRGAAADRLRARARG